ncbi:endolytic transglycosylase MltG [Pseudoalteromonas sp. T1lg65]|uniref:endolytic transglycosylase MltG n=1 Tax=Pseudoalteromonas sp. T1lg65 TaxID=2077101 RepID=UPI003F7A7A41
MIKKLFVLFLTFFVVFALWLDTKIDDLKKEKFHFDGDFLVIDAGSSFAKLCRNWQQSNYIKNCYPYLIYSKFSPELFSLQTGVYDVKGLTVLEVIAAIRQGKQHSFSFTIIEGEAIWDVLDKLKSSPYLINDIEDIVAQLAIPYESAEGWFYPDTYHYHGREKASELLARAYKKMQLVLSTEWQQRQQGLPLNSPYEALILASIIEKETGKPSERKTVSSVFINRLRKGMRLQTDPTIIYGIGPSFDGDIKRRDINTHTRYNTYKINGLTPTPIAMPSKDAINAALNPETTDYYYFVASGDGGHYFSSTLSEHNKAVKKYLLNKGGGS